MHLVLCGERKFERIVGEGRAILVCRQPFAVVAAIEAQTHCACLAAIFNEANIFHHLVCFENDEWIGPTHRIGVGLRHELPCVVDGVDEDGDVYLRRVGRLPEQMHADAVFIAAGSSGEQVDVAIGCGKSGLG